MSTPSQSLDIPVINSATQVPGWLREPLLHFVVLGAVLFFADHLLVTRANDPYTIVVDAAVDKEAIDVFKAARGQEPGKEELAALRQIWLDNEVLYREGLALQVDKGDPAIREKVIFKALSVVDASIKLPPTTEQVLRDWFAKHHEKYDEPARYDFQEAALVGDNDESAVRSFVTALNSGAPGDANAGLRVFKGRPHANLVQSYGEEFAKELDQSPIGKWLAFHTRDGWRAVRLDAVTPAKPAVFEIMHGMVRQDWIDEAAAEKRTAAVRALAKKYKVKYESAAT